MTIPLQRYHSRNMFLLWCGRFCHAHDSGAFREAITEYDEVLECYIPGEFTVVFYSGCPNQEIRWQFLCKGLIQQIYSYFGADSAT
jgi:hypothetical protein